MMLAGATLAASFIIGAATILMVFHRNPQRVGHGRLHRDHDWEAVERARSKPPASSASTPDPGEP